MKKSEKGFIQETKDFWQPYYGEKFLTDEDAREIYKNITGLQWVEENNLKRY